MGRNILIATKGLDELIPEMLGVFNFNNNCDFYENHPEKDAIRKKFNILPITDLWLVGTDSSRKDTDCTERFLSLLGSSAPKLKRWVLKDVDDIYSEENNSQYNDLVLRVVALAKNIVRKEKGQLTLSLAGGRKTMSASMQNAALYFGCDCIMHVLAKTPKVSANDFLHMTKEEFETAGIFPLNLGKQDGNEIFNDLLELSCVDELMRCGDPDDKEVKWQGDREFEKKS